MFLGEGAGMLDIHSFTYSVTDSFPNVHDLVCSR